MMRRKVIALLALAPLTMFSGTSQAAEAAAASETSVSSDSSSSSGSVEKVEVTGSRLKRLDVEGPSPVQTITREQLDQSGYNSVADVLRDTTLSSFGVAREDSGSNASGNAEISLRGLGSNRTLVLLNGQRMPMDAVTGAVDLNMIPMAAIERVEVLKDGASAIYGSDALAGVVNFITRKDFKGTQVNASQTVSELGGGNRTSINLVNGTSIGGLNAVTTVDFRNNQRMFDRERPWSNEGFSFIGNPGTYQDYAAGAEAVPFDNCPEEDVLFGGDGYYCTYKYSDVSSQLPDLRQTSVATDLTYDLSPTVRLNARLSGSQRLVKWNYAPAPDAMIIGADVVDQWVADGTSLPGHTAGNDMILYYRLTELGTRDSEDTSYSWGATGGATIDLSSSWQLKTTLNHNVITTEMLGVNGYALIDAVQAKLASGEYNPFAEGDAKGSLEDARYEPSEKTTAMVSSIEAVASGDLLELPAGPMGLALGVSATRQSYNDVFDEQSLAGNVYGTAGSSGKGMRVFESAFAELSIPVLSGMNLSAAGRFDNYSDFGTTINPKLAAEYRPLDSLLVRGSWGTGFAAPRMQDLYAGDSYGYPTFIDYVACENSQASGDAEAIAYDCAPHQYLVGSSGNEDLQEETSTSYNVGVVFEPSKNFNIGVDYYAYNLKNAVGLSLEDMTKAEAAGVDVSEYGVITNRDPDGYLDQTLGIYAPTQNLSEVNVNGVDVTAALGFWDLRLSTEHSLLLGYKQSGFPGTDLRDVLGENGLPAWRNTTSVSYRPMDQHNVVLTAVTVAGHQKAVKEEGNLPGYATLNLDYTYDAKSWGAVTVGVRNLLNTTPPLDTSNQQDQLDISLYDQLMRQFLVSYKVSI